MTRVLTEVHAARPSRDGDGVKINRIAGSQMHRVLDPFLMIDEINSETAEDYLGGFPEHPHRGFETITYMKAGRMRHRDHMGNEGVIGPGDVQWMTAGRGVLHSEMPEQEQGLMHGFQIWLNLPASEKLKPAAYRDIRSAELERYQDEQVTLCVISGEIRIAGTRVRGRIPVMQTRPLLADLCVSAGAEIFLDTADYASVLVFVYAGNSTALSTKQLGVYANAGKLRLEAGPRGFEALILAGKPLREPIVQHGPFVMNRAEEIDAAIRDYQRGSLVGDP